MKKIALYLCSAALLFGCNDDEGGMDPDQEPVMFTVQIENLADTYSFISSGVFNTPDGEDAPGPITPGKKYVFEVQAGKSSRLSFATMLAATNDLFYAPAGEGLSLYDSNGDPITGELTDQIYLWDAGTEVNEEPAVGPNTVTNQTAPNTGPDENGTVELIGNITTDDFDYPEVADVIKVSVEHLDGINFRIEIENVSDNMALQTSQGDMPAPMSPGVWVIHNGANPLFEEGEADYGQGIEGIAEDGNPTNLGTYTAENTGTTYFLSPGAYAIHSDDKKPIFTEGSADYGEGLEAIAEDGSAATLGNSLTSRDGVTASGVFNTPTGSSAPGPAKSGTMYEFSFEAVPGENLSFATMLAITNDLFFAPGQDGIPLFDDNGMPVTGDKTSLIKLWDAGTEVNEAPGLGPNTVNNQSAPNTGPDENGTVTDIEEVSDGYTYPSVGDVLRVTISMN